MADEEVLVPGIDTTRPSVARVYDFWLGGKDHYLCDREMGRRMAELNPALPQLVRDNRAFLAAAAGRAAEAGIGQFLDLGAGLSTGHYDDAVLAARLQETAAHARFHNHDAATMAGWLTGLEIVPPGICEGRAWAAGTGGVPVDRQAYALAAAAIKTA